jgi:hypothetical protein
MENEVGVLAATEMRSTPTPHYVLCAGELGLGVILDGRLLSFLLGLR